MTALQAIAQVAVPVAVAIIMFCLGVGLEVRSFRRSLQNKLVLCAVLVWQLTLFPLVALGVAKLLGLDGALTIGLVLIAACPSSTPSNLLTRLASGDVALSVTLTALTEAIMPLTMPLALAVAAHVTFAGDRFAISLWRMSVSLLALGTMPMVLGMALRHFRPAAAVRMEPVALRVAGCAFAVGLLFAIAGAWGQIPESLLRAGPVCLLLNVLALCIASVLARAGGLEPQQQAAVVLASSTRSFAMAAFVSVNLLKNPRWLSPAIAYCLIMWVTAGLVARIRHQRRADAAASSSPGAAVQGA